MTIFGYARVSTTDQDLTVQESALKAAGCTVIRSEKVSGTSTAGRAELANLLDFIREGDTLVVTRIDRLARSIGDLQDIVRSLKTKGAALRATEQPIDTSTAAGKAFLDMLGVFAEFETNLRKERQLEGIAQAKAKGVYKGRTKSIDRTKVAELQASGLGATEIAEKLRIGRSSVYRVLGTSDKASEDLHATASAPTADNVPTKASVQTNDDVLTHDVEGDPLLRPWTDEEKKQIALLEEATRSSPSQKHLEALAVMLPPDLGEDDAKS